uniref:Uncharacterized protein n=1 Tax=Knipowitschia caucasica TaxID=637954 RepID=A0AAV2LXR9_KNICA
MASARCVLTEDHLLCSICLEVFTDPVSTSCGHSFCKTCINQHWNHSEQYHCPICNEDFSVKPQLKTNTFMSEMVSQFRASPEEPEEQTGTGGVPCDVCSTPRLRALKSCLVCLASFCPTHLDPHLRTPRLQRHPLIHPVQNLEERICPEHGKPLDLLCQTEKMFICVHCSVSRHKDHVSVPLEEECERQQTELEEIVKQRKQKIQEIQGSVKVNNQNADRELSEGVKVFSAMMESVQKSQHQFRERIKADQKAVEDRAAEIIEQLEQEICVLQWREAGMKQALKYEDHFSFIQTFSENTASDFQDLTNTMVSPHAHDDLVDKALSELQKTLLLHKKKKSEELKRVQQFEVDCPRLIPTL